MHWNGDWHMGWMGLWWILIVPVLIALVWFALSAGRRRDGAQQVEKSAPPANSSGPSHPSPQAMHPGTSKKTAKPTSRNPVRARFSQSPPRQLRRTAVNPTTHRPQGT